jgi:hypothetical protein
MRSEAWAAMIVRISSVRAKPWAASHRLSSMSATMSSPSHSRSPSSSRAQWATLDSTISIQLSGRAAGGRRRKNRIRG